MIPELACERLLALSLQHQWTFLGLMADAVSANENVSAGIALRCGADTIVDTGRCTLHQGQRTFEHATADLNLSGAIHCIGCAMKSSKNQTALMGALLRIGNSVAIRDGPPPQEARDYADWVMDHSIFAINGIHFLSDERQQQLKRHLEDMKPRVKKFLNGRWWLPDLEYYEDGSSGLTIQEVKDGVCGVLCEVIRMIFDLDGNEGRWFALMRAVKPFIFGCRCHYFLPRALRLMCAVPDPDEDLRDADQDTPQVIFAKRLKRGVRRLTEENIGDDFMVLATTSVPIIDFKYFLHSEGHNPRRKTRNNDAPPSVQRGILRGLVANDRAIIREVSTKIAKMIVEPSFWERARFKTSTMTKAQAALLRCGGDFFYRISEYFKGTPLDLLLLEDMSREVREMFWKKLFDELNKCCMRPFFCRRVQERSSAEAIIDDKHFEELLDFWSLNGECGTTIRNEHQNARMSKAIKIKSRGGPKPKASRVMTMAFVKTLRDDHATTWSKSKRSRPGMPKRNKAKKDVKSATRVLKRTLKRKSRCGKTQFALVTGRTPKLEYVNTMARKAKIDRLASLPAVPGKKRNLKRSFAFTKTEWQGLRAQLGQDQPYILKFALPSLGKNPTRSHCSR